MKTNFKVRCVKSTVGVDYLTVGKVYKATAHDHHKTAFTVTNDYGWETFCIYPSCAHAEWELVE